MRIVYNSGDTFDLIDPASGKVFDSIRLSTTADVDSAVDAALQAFPRWRQTDWESRSRILRSTAAALREHAEELAASLTLEQGKTLKEARIEVARCADTFDFYADDRFAPRISQRELEGKQAWVAPLPLGVVAAIVPWNFPLTLLANKLVPAMAAGNTVVVKPAQTTPLTTRRLLELLAQAGLTEGAVTMVLGEAAVGEALVTHPNVAMVSFTGSTQTGRAIMAAAAGSVKRLALELGGSDALIVDSDASVAGAAKAAAVGRFFNAGQACIDVKRAFVHEDVYEEFLDALVTRIDRLVVGDGREPGVLIGPVHTAAQRDHIQGMIHDAVAKGARVVRGGGVPDGRESGYFLEPTVLVDVPPDAVVLTEEVFGPVLPVVRVSSFDEAIDRANESEFGLGFSVWSNTPENVERAVFEVESGYTWINDMSTDYDALPFGGVKQSGFGKERGEESIDEFRNLKAIVAPDESGVFG